MLLLEAVLIFFGAPQDAISDRFHPLVGSIDMMEKTKTKNTVDQFVQSHA